jgi:hypothetical protein
MNKYVYANNGWWKQVNVVMPTTTMSRHVYANNVLVEGKYSGASTTAVYNDEHARPCDVTAMYRQQCSVRNTETVEMTAMINDIVDGQSRADKSLAGVFLEWDSCKKKTTRVGVTAGV